jgi:hypothetical protein
MPFGGAAPPGCPIHRWPWHALDMLAHRMLVGLSTLVACGPVVSGDATDTSGTEASASTAVTSASTTVPGTTASTDPDPTVADVASDPSVADGDPDSTGAGEETGDPIVPPVQHFDLERVVSGGPWAIVQDTGGIAVRPDEVVLIADGQALYAVEGGEVITWLDASDMSAPADVDVDPDGSVYVLDALGFRVLEVTGPHAFSEVASVAPMQGPINLGVVDVGLVAVRGWSDGLWAVGNDGNAVIFSERALQGAQGCATEELAVQTSGVFIYQPGCNGSPLVMGNVDGSGIRNAFEFDFGGGSISEYTNAICSTRAPGAGFYSVLEFDISNIELVYLQEDATQNSGWGEVTTTPTFAQGMEITDEPLGFRYCGVAVSPSSTLYLQTGRELWVGTPGA